jgi:23S rRNA (uracil1939-C5)-methyltransferase
VVERIRIESLAFGGLGVGHLASGMAVLVEGSAPGDVADVEIVRQKRTLAFGRIVALLEPSGLRVAPRCDLAGRCGGCSWAHITMEGQRRAKLDLLAGELRRAGLLETGDEIAALKSGADLGYRVRTRLHRRGRVLGTMARGSDEVIPYTRCLVLAEPLHQFASELAAASARMPHIDAEIELYVDARSQRGMHVTLTDPISGPTWSRTAAELAVRSVVVGSGPQPGADWLFETSGDLEIAFTPGVFVQANREMNGDLVSTVSQMAGREGRFAELYAGAGNFTVHLARRLDQGWAAEGDGGATAALTKNLTGHEVSVRVYTEPDSRSARRLEAEPSVDLLVCDPPRGGMKRVTAAMGRSPASRIVMVSCHPMTAIRDMAALARAGWALRSVQPVDMFPHTHHLEIVSLLERR